MKELMSWRLLKKNISKKKKLIAGTGSVSFRETLELTKKAYDLGYDAAMVVTPYYYVNYMKDDVLIKYYRTLADSVRIPIILYNIPQFSGVKSLSQDTVKTLSKHENIIGIKESGAVEQAIQFAEITKAINPNFLVFNGSASSLLLSLRKGCDGGIMAAANFASNFCWDIWQKHKETEKSEVETVQEKLKVLNDNIVVNLSVAGVKEVMNRLGHYVGDPRLPIYPLSKTDKEQVNTLVATMLRII